MEVWVIPVLSAIIGATLALIGKELIEWYKRPRLEIDFEERGNEKPYIVDQNDFIAAAMGDLKGVYRIKHLRLRIRNKGKKAALNCEAKIEISHSPHKNYSVDAKILHWARRHELLYTKGLNISNPAMDIEKMYSTVDINRNDWEYLEVLRMHYWYLASQGMPQDLSSQLISASVEAIALQFSPDTEYSIKISVFSQNAKPVSRSFNIKWDGTVHGFNSTIVL